MKFAFSSNAFTNYSLVDSINEISKIGYQGVEIMCDIPHAYPPKLNENEILDIKKALEINNLQISNLNAFTLFGIQDTYHPSWLEPDKKHRDARIKHTIDCIKLASLLGANNISIEPGGPIENKSTQEKEKYYEIFFDGIEQIIPYAESEKVKVLIEPEPELLIETSSEFLYFIKDIKSKYIKLNFDIGHFFCVNENPSILISTLKEYIEHFHMADIKGRKHFHLIPGLGSISFKEIFQSILDIDYKGFVTVELYPYKENPQYAAYQSFEFIKGFGFLNTTTTTTNN